MESKPLRTFPCLAGAKDDDRDFKSGSPTAKGSYSGEWRTGIISRTNSPAECKSSPLERETSMDLVDAEFERLKYNPSVIVPEVATTQVAKNFVNGFKIISMNMSDAFTGKEIWKSGLWDASTMFDDEIEERIPSEILECRSVSRELEFSSTEEIRKFRLEQRVYFRGTCIEEWFFSFGYVIAGSRNTWQQTIDAAPPSQMLDAQVLSGNIVFETSFFDDKMFLCKNSVRIYYI